MYTRINQEPNYWSIWREHNHKGFYDYLEGSWQPPDDEFNEAYRKGWFEAREIFERVYINNVVML